MAGIEPAMREKAFRSRGKTGKVWGEWISGLLLSMLHAHRVDTRHEKKRCIFAPVNRNPVPSI